MLFLILIFTFIGSFVSLLIASLLLLRGKLVEERTHWLVAFAAGAMLAAAFFDLIPEAIREIRSVSPSTVRYGASWRIGGFGEFGEQGISGTVLVGMVTFFFLERFLFWYHHHSCPEGEECEGTKPAIPLIITGDTFHNFLDGVTITAAFLASPELGVITSLAVFFHEIPHEIGNFGALLALKMKRVRVLGFNILSALAAFAGAIVSFFFLRSFETVIPYLIAFAAGNFIYISAADLIPELHRTFEPKSAVSQTLSFVFGILVIFLTIRMFG